MFRMSLIAVSLTASIAYAQQQREIQYQETILPFSEWAAKFPQEKAVMGLFKNYEEPTVQYMLDGVLKREKKKLVIYAVRMRSAVNKPASQIKLADLIKLDSIRQLDRQTKYQTITAAQAMPATVTGKGPVPNFAWCNADPAKPDFNLPNFELPLQHLAGEKWCEANGRTLCVESCYHFTGGWATSLAWVNDFLRGLGTRPEKLKDNGLASNAEVRYFSSDTEYGHNLKALTQIDTPIHGVVEMRIFYSNQVFQYGKVLAVFHEHPANRQNPTKPPATLISTFVALGIGQTTWNKKMYYPLQRAMLGERNSEGKPVFKPCPTEITAGIPSFSYCMADAISNLIEKQ